MKNVHEQSKTLLLLGGLAYLEPVIREAHALGIRVITCDYLPNNPAHVLSDRYLNISIVDKDAVLKAAREAHIDGVMSFACDPGVVTAAYVAEQMGLPFQCSYEVACILQDKGRFRDFLQKHSFNCPHAKCYAENETPEPDIDFFSWPVIVKPVDSAGSKGCTRVDRPEWLPAAIAKALSESQAKRYVIEDFLTFESAHTNSDMFTVGGTLTCVSYADHLFDRVANNPYAPIGTVWPSQMHTQYQDELTRELQRLMSLLQVRTGIWNVETVVGAGGLPYIMEVSPRGGGNRTAEVEVMACCPTLIANEVRKAVNLPLLSMEEMPIQGVWTTLTIYPQSGQTGFFKALKIRSDVKKRYIRQISLSVKPGDCVLPFTGSNRSLGNLFLQCPTRQEFDSLLADIPAWLNVEVL